MGSFPDAVVLQASVNVIWFLVVYIDGVELPYGGGIVLDPVFSGVIGDVHSTVISVYQMALKFRVGPLGLKTMIWIVTLKSGIWYSCNTTALLMVV